MTKFSSLILCLVGIAVTSAWSINEKSFFLPPISRTQRQKPRRLALLPSSMENIQRMTILKNALEFKCFRELCNHPRYRHLCLGPNPLLMKTPMPPSEAQLLHFNKMTGKQFSDLSNNRMFFPDGRVVYLQPNIYYINKGVNLPLSGKEPKFHLSPQITSSGKTTKEYPHQTEQTPLRSVEGRTAEQKIKSENKTVHIESKPEGGDLGSVKPIAPTSQFPTTSTSSVRPYEVKEIVDEKPDDTYNNNFDFGGKKIFLVKEETKKTPEVQRADVKNSTTPSEFLAKYGTIQKSQTPLVVLKTYQNASQLLKKTNETKPPKSRKEHQKYLKLTLPPVLNTPIRVQKPKTLSEPTGATTKRTTTTTRQQHKELVYTPSGVIFETSLNPSGFIKNLQERTTAKVSEPTEKLSFWDLTHPPASQEPTSRESVTVSAKEMISDTSKSYSTNSKPVTLTTSEFQTTTSVISGRDYTEDTDLDWSLAKDINTSPKTVFQTVEYFSEATINEADLTTTNFKEFTDQPLVFDLFTRMKSEQKKQHESKNSRKMHFGQKPRKNPTSNDISYPDHPEQRRSDILINDNIDYFDYENMFSGLNYLERLTYNNSAGVFNPQLNLTSDRIIPLIPVVINDLKEGKIPPEDIPALSQAFGKYWAAVLTLSNTTNLDMLPVMKMKDDYDLETVLLSLQEEGFEPMTMEKAEDVSPGPEYDFYDYMENYRELYKDIDQQGDQEAGENGLDVTEDSN